MTTLPIVYYDRQEFGRTKLEDALEAASKWKRFHDAEEVKGVTVDYDYQDNMWYVTLYIKKKRSE